MAQEEKTLTKTPQELVHIKHEISATQYKYWFILIKIFQDFLLSGVKSDEKGFYSIPISEIEKLMGYEISRKYLKEDLFSLTSTGIAFNYLEKNGEKVFYGASFLSEFKLFSKTLKFRLPSFIQDVLEGNSDIKKMFLIMDWNIFNSFSGKYEAIIYKLCKDYVGVGRTPYFTVKDYRDYIGLDEKEYNQFFRLKEWTLSKPIKNINNNEISDILVEVVLKKQGRNVVGLHFEVKYKPNSKIPKITTIETSPAFEHSLIYFNFQKQREYLEKYSQDEIKAIIDYVNNQHKQGKIKNLSGFYAKAFDNGWGLENFKVEQEENRKKEELKKQKKAEKDLEKQKEMEEKANKEAIIKKFYQLSEQEQLERIQYVIKNSAPILSKKLKDNFERFGLAILEESRLFYAEYHRLIEKTNNV